MKNWHTYFLAGLLCVFATCTALAQQPVMTVSITGIGVGAGSTPITPVTERSGPYGTPIRIEATAVGTTMVSSFTYSFYVEGQHIGTSSVATSGPEVITWIPPQPGSYFITVIANDGNNTAHSLPVRYFATGTIINSPVDNTIVPVGSSVVLKADATTGGGFIKQIQFFDNGVPIGTPDTTYPYSLIYTPTGAAGSVSVITAQATDNNNALLTVSLPISLNLITPILPTPTVAVTSPTDGSAVAVPTGVNTIPIAVAANASSGRITKVEIYIDGALHVTDSTFPYTADWAPTAVGVYRITALAYDDKNNVTASPTNAVNISAPPTVAISSPVNGSFVASGTATTVSANAADSDGTITQVEFFADGVFLGVDTTAPYSVSWTPAYKPDNDEGPAATVITAIAKDNVGLSTVSLPVSVFVTSGGGGGGTPVGLPPVTAITTPTNLSTVAINHTTTINAIASDPDGTISGVQFYANGVSIGTAPTFPYSVTWTPTAAGVYTLKSTATDNDGNQTSSADVAVTVIGGTPPVVAITSPVIGSQVGLNATTTIQATATDADGTISSVQFFANGVSLGTDTSAPYSVYWTPVNAGTYALTAVATDNSGFQSASTTVVVFATGQAPSVSITGPVGPVTINTPHTITVTAIDADGTISGVQFFVNGVSVGTDVTYPFTATWTPSVPGAYNLTAVATDNSGMQSTSATSVVTAVPNQPPVVVLTSPAGNIFVSVSTPVNLAATAGDSDGTVTVVEFYANSIKVGSSALVPYAATWSPSLAGTYQVTARATDNSGNVTISNVVTVTVAANIAPVVQIASPTSGSTVRLNTNTTITATASDPDGVVASVAFYANNVSIGVDATAPYSVTWNPTAEGAYQLTAVVTDNAGAAITSATVHVLVVNAANVLGDAIYSGIYSGGGEQGRFTAINMKGLSAVIIAHTTAGDAKTYYHGSIPVNGAGGFSVTGLSGSFSPTGVMGTIDGGRLTFIGPITFPGGVTVASGYFAGNLTGNLSSVVVAIIASDGTATFYVKDGTFEDAGTGIVGTGGAFTVTTLSGNAFTGTVNPSTGFLTGTLSGARSGTFTGALASGNTFSDGVMKNISTRGQVGAGDEILIAGFVVGGSTPKQVFVRGVGPTLANYGVTGVLADPYLRIYKGTALIAENDNWGGPAVMAQAQAAVLVGAFPLPTNSNDAAILTTLSPGVYTAQVSGVGGTTGNAIVEIYDMEIVNPFTSQKVVNLSTRGDVGTGDNMLIAGLVVSGSAPKKMLVRTVGQTLSAYGVTGTLADPILRIIRDGVTVRENDNWEVGNDPALVTAATTGVGGFPLPAGSKDAAILITLPPGVYTAQVTGADGTTGVALVEIYEVQ